MTNLPKTEKMNIFQLWRENGEVLPFKAVLDSWNNPLHYVLVEKIEIKTWPYGDAYGQYFFYGKPGEKGLIRNAGVYRWKFK